MQTGMLTTESVRQQEVQQPRASATSAAPGSVSHPQTEDLLALKEKNFQSILEGCYHSTKPQSIEEWNWFREYAKEMRLIITGVSVGSLVITVKCESLMILEELWKDYSSGHLGEVVQNCFVTERILKELNLAELRLKTTMDIEEYNACKMFFEKDALRGSTSRSPQKKEQWEKSEWKTKIMEMAKLEGMLPLPGSSTFDPEEELVEPRLKRQRMEGSFPVLKFSTINLEGTLAYVRVELQRLEGTFFPPALLNADLEEKLKKLLTELERQRDTGSLPPTFSTIEVEVELDERLKKFQKWRIEGGSVPSNRRYILRQDRILAALFRSTSSTSESPQKKEQWEKSEQKTKIMETVELEAASSSVFRSTSSTSESPQKKEQWEKSEQKTTIMERTKLKGTLPLIVVPTTGHGKEPEERWGRKGMLPLPGSSIFDLQEKLEELLMKLQIMKGSSSLPVTDLKEKLEQVFEEIRMLRMKGSFSVLKLSTIDLEKKLAELRMKLQRLRVEGTLPPPELFTADLEKELERLEQLLIEQRERMKGSSHFLVETVIRLRKELEKVKMEALENAMYLTIRSGLAKFDVSLPEELQNYVSYLLDESAKLHLRKQVLQPPRALEELREAMDKGELKTFLTIHIREGAWQVVLLFMDELPKYKLPWDWCGIILIKDEDEEVSNEVIYSSTSGILNGWPTHYDPSLKTLCKAITNQDWKVTRLILSLSRIPDEGLKNLSTALTQSELYSLTLCDIGLQSQGLEHLCNALTSVNCRLTNLNVSNNQLGDNGLKHLCDALTSSNCALTKLIVGSNRLGDGGIKELSEVLTKGFCTLTSLDIRGNEFGDEGIKHLCKALTDTKCKLRSLNLRANWYVTDDGKKYLSQMLTGTDWEDEGALRLSRSTTKETKEQVSDTEP